MTKIINKNKRIIRKRTKKLRGGVPNFIKNFFTPESNDEKKRKEQLRLAKAVAAAAKKVTQKADKTKVPPWQLGGVNLGGLIFLAQNRFVIKIEFL